MSRVVWDVAKKELRTTFRSKRTLLITILLFLGVAIIPAFKVEDTLGGAEVTTEVLLPMVDAFLMIAFFAPLFVASRVAESAFLAERDRKTLEHLLSLPVSDRDLFLGKFLPGLVVGIVVEIAVAASLLAFMAAKFPMAMAGAAPLVPALVVTILVMGPVLIALSVLVVLVLSTRLSSTREASMGSLGVVLIPVILYMLKFTGTVPLDPLAFNAVASLLLGVVSLALAVLGVGTFNRERLVAAV